MQKILDLMSDPTWWFSTVIVAVIAGVIGGLLTNRVDPLIAGLPAKIADYLARRRRARQRLVEEISGDTFEMTVFYIRSWALAIISISVMILSSVAGIQVSTLETKSVPRQVLYEAFRFVLGLMAIYFSFRGARNMSIFGEAAKLYRERTKPNGQSSR
jgi:uncharacterized membrane protein YfcA